MAGIRAFLVGAAKIAAALIMAAAVFVAGVATYSGYQERQRNRREAPFAEKKTWPTTTILGELPVEVATALRNGRVHYIVAVTKFSESLYQLDDEAFLSLQFSDRDGFKLWQKAIPQTAMASVNPSDGTGVSGFQWVGDEHVGIDDYERAVSVAVGWSGWSKRQPKLNPELLQRTPKAAPLVPGSGRLWESLANWRRLSVGQTQFDVRELLGEPTAINRYSSTYLVWRYGDVLGGGEVTFNPNVTGWHEPDR